MLTKEDLDFVLSKTKKTEYFKRLAARKFKSVLNYADYSGIASTLALILMLAPEEIHLRTATRDPVYEDSLHSAWLAYKSPVFPVYAIKEELANAFLQSDIPSHICGLQKQFEIALFLLPKNLIKNPDGKSCEWLLVTYFPVDDIKLSPFKYDNFLESISNGCLGLGNLPDLTQRKLRWITMLGHTCAYNNTMELPEGGNAPIKGEFLVNDEFAESDISKERAFTNKVDNLLLQTLLYMQTPRQKAQLGGGESKTLGRQQKQGFGSESALTPIWIGAEYKQPAIRKPHQGGSHASPQTHWRRGHYREVSISRGSEEKRLAWVRPTIVNG
jgi:hypothetical protein